MKILVTGCAGFIGYHLSEKFLRSSKKNLVFGVDSLNQYYDVDLKKNRLKNLKKNKNFSFKKIDVCELNLLNNFIIKNKISFIVHLAAQAGVRHSIKYPQTYFENNILGFNNILEICRLNKIKHLIFASTSSVYGNSKKFPLKESNNTDNPLTFYAASKKANEVCAFSYSNIYKIPITGLRFFTVYGSYGRPDMALFKFTKNIIKNKKIDIYNFGNHERDFTHVDDVTSAIIKLLRKPSEKKIPYNIFNLGSGNPISLKNFIIEIEKLTNKKSKKNYLPLQKGDVRKTFADIKLLEKYINFKPKYNINNGVANFIKWYKEYYNV